MHKQTQSNNIKHIYTTKTGLLVLDHLHIMQDFLICKLT